MITTQRIPPAVVVRLRAAFARLVEMENDPDIDWKALLEMREHADPLSDDSYYRGYIVGLIDALGISVTDLLHVVQTKPRRRIVQVRRAG